MQKIPWIRMESKLTLVHQFGVQSAIFAANKSPYLLVGMFAGSEVQGLCLVQESGPCGEVYIWPSLAVSY